MKLSYILQNKDGSTKRIPRGQAWQWKHELDNFDQIVPIFEWIQARINVDRVSLFNVYLDHVEITSSKNIAISFFNKLKINYSIIIEPNRVIDMQGIKKNTN